jgi:hypothetical protein
MKTADALLFGILRQTFNEQDGSHESKSFKYFLAIF